MNQFQREMRKERIITERRNKLLIRKVEQQKIKAERDRKLLTDMLDTACPEWKKIT